MCKHRSFLLTYTILLLIIEHLCLYYLGKSWNVFDKIVYPIAILYCIPILKTKVVPIKAKWAFIIYILFGIFANAIYQYQPLNAVLQDVLLNLKFFLSICIGYESFKHHSIECYKDRIIKFAKYALLGIFILTTINLYIGQSLFPFYEDGRFWGHSVMLFFGHPTNLTATTIFCFSLFVAFSKERLFSLRMLLFIGAAFFIMFASGRYKGISVLVGFIYLYWRFFVTKKLNRFKVDWFFVLAVVLYITYDQMLLYFIQVDGSARSAMLVGSVNIAKDHFPLGAGFGTFGSSASTIVSYSPIYRKYGLSSIWGLGEGDARFVSDNYVATLLGQTGAMTFLFVYFIYKLFAEIIKLKSIETRYFLSAILPLMYIVFSSLSECSFVAIYSMPMGFWIGTMIGQRKQKE